MEIYEMASAKSLCDISNMPVKMGKKAEAEASARNIYTKLMRLPRPSEIDSESKWIKRAGVSRSFFTNMAGVKKPPSDPTVHNLRLVLEAVGVTLPEFFADEGRGRLAALPSRQALALALHDAMPLLPKSPDRRVQYLADIVARLLELPPDDQSTAAIRDAADEAAA